MSWIGRLVSALDASFWFVPVLTVLASILLAVGAIEGDRLLGAQAIGAWPWALGSGDGARNMLQAIASSMVTVAGVVFSITIVTLALTSNQYTSRILRNFVRDRVNQASLGIFLGIYAYCLVVLRITQATGGDGIPAIAVLVGFALALLGIGVLIYFIHHIATAIQASNVIARVAHETLRALDKPFPARLAEAANTPGGSDQDLAHDADWLPIPSARTGFIERLRENALLRVLRKRDLVLRMDRAVGDFVAEGQRLCSVQGRGTEGAAEALNRIYSIQPWPSVAQDVHYGIKQLVDVAAKALSPGINDQTTAEICIDYLRVILVRAAGMRFPSHYRANRGKLRVIAKAPGFEDLLELAFDGIRRNATGHVGIILRLIDALEAIAGAISDAGRFGAVAGHFDAISETADRSVESARDRNMIARARLRVVRLLPSGAPLEGVMALSGKAGSLP